VATSQGKSPPHRKDLAQTEILKSLLVKTARGNRNSAPRTTLARLKMKTAECVSLRIERNGTVGSLDVLFFGSKHPETTEVKLEPGAPLHRLSGLEMENRIDSYSAREEPLLLGLRDGLEILTDVHPQPEVSLISGRNCGRDRLG
jgi:hypothetical protein